MGNPFTPNFGQIPLHMAGRGLLIDEITNALENAPGDPALTSIIVGARGTGKTALLSLLAREAQQRSWIAVNVSCVPGMLDDILQHVLKAAANLIDVNETARLKGISFGRLLGLEWEREEDVEPNWRIRMTSILEKLAERDIGLLITVDEVQPSLDEMILLASVYQHFIREERKVGLLMAGLPSQVSGLLTNESVSFLRRASQYQIGRIEAHEIELAFAQTIEQSGRVIEADALKAAVQAIDGFPFMLQLVGYRTWQASKNDLIGPNEVAVGSSRAADDMKSRVLKSTLDELSDKDLAFLEAMLLDQGASAVADLAVRLEQTSGYVSQYRRRLLEQGVIGTRGRGRVGFDLPELRNYLPEYLEQRW